MINLTEISVKNLITHFIGNKLREEKCFFATAESVIHPHTEGYLLEYFFQKFKTEEVYRFGHSIDLKHNVLFELIRSIFLNNSLFIEKSSQVAQLLYECSDHPRIKSGDLNIAYIQNILVGDELVDGIGIFKSEIRSPFLQFESNQSHFDIVHDEGYDVNKVDKAFLCLNVDSSEGFQCLVFDSKSQYEEAQFWKEDFLRLTPMENEYYKTSEFMTMTKSFVEDHAGVTLGVDRADQIDLLNKSLGYFKSKEVFDQSEFEADVLQKPSLIDDFREFEQDYQGANFNPASEGFAISESAVKNQKRVYKSILKLDKNFHVYIHGDRSKIERGIENDGRKYYKIYFEQEH